MGPVLRPEDIVPNWPAYAGFRQASPDYFETMRMPILRGRPFTQEDREGAVPVAIVSQPLADLLWPGQDPIGKIVRTNYLSTLWLTVVGVVPEARNWSQPAGSQHEIYTPIAQHPTAVNSGLYLVLRTRSQPEDFAPGVRERLREIAPDLPIVIQTMDERLAATARDRRFAMFVLLAFAGVALTLAAVGIYSVVSYTTAIRTREIGVRIAVGATPAVVQREIVLRAAAVTLAGVAAGMLTGLLATRAIQSLLFQVRPLDSLTFTIGALVLIVVALLAAWIPARNFSRLDPLVALRADSLRTD
jgi:putative ABC transport system permease protein